MTRAVPACTSWSRSWRPCASPRSPTRIDAASARLHRLPLRPCASPIRQTTVKNAWTPLGTPAAPAACNPTRVTRRSRSVRACRTRASWCSVPPAAPSTSKSPNAYEQPRWEVTVKLDSGQKRVVTVAYEPFVREGDRVRVAGNSVELVD